MNLEKAIKELIKSQNFNACISRKNSCFSVWLCYNHSYMADDKLENVYRLCSCVRDEETQEQIRKQTEFALNTSLMFSNDWDIVGYNDTIIHEYSVDELKNIVFAKWTYNSAGGYTLDINDALFGSVSIDPKKGKYKYGSKPDVPRRAEQWFDNFEDAVNNTKARVEEFLSCVSVNISVYWPENPKEINTVE